MDRLVQQFFNSAIWWRHWEEFARGLGLTIGLAIAVVLTGLALGIALALIRAASGRPI